MSTDEPIIWTGDLNDDCTAIWQGLILRAEWMDENFWWWAVSFNDGEQVELDSSNNNDQPCSSGIQARWSAEQAARNYLSKKVNSCGER